VGNWAALREKLHAAGIHTAYDFVQLPESWVLKNMTIVGLRLQKELRGIPAIEMEMPEKRQSIATTRSFDRDYRGFDELREAGIDLHLYRGREVAGARLYVSSGWSFSSRRTGSGTRPTSTPTASR